jgi:hypothetical protein
MFSLVVEAEKSKTLPLDSQQNKRIKDPLKSKTFNQRVMNQLSRMHLLLSLLNGKCSTS